MTRGLRECQVCWGNDRSQRGAENCSSSSLIHTVFWEQPGEQLLHQDSEENCFGESSYKLARNRWSELKIKHYSLSQVNLCLLLALYLIVKCHRLQFLQHHFKLYHEDFDPRSTKNNIHIRMLCRKSLYHCVLVAMLTGATGIGRNYCF